MLYKFSNLYEINHSNHHTLYSMEGLRGLATILIFLVHYSTLSQPWISTLILHSYYASIVHALGNVGVDLFFVLSGFLIYGSLITSSPTFIKYFSRRIQRIYPTFTVVFIIYIGLSIFFPSKNKVPSQFWEASQYVLENFLLLPGLFDIEPIITVAWSLSYEFFFYLSVPILIYSLNLKSWKAGHRILFFLLLAITILIAPSLFGGHVRFAMFISGILVFECSKFFIIPRKMDLFGIVALILALMITALQSLYGFNGQWKFAGLTFFFLILCLACFSLDGMTSKIFRWTPIRWLGNISYSFYLTHSLVLNAFFLALPKLFPQTGSDLAIFWLCLPLSFIFSFLASSLLFAYVEKPLSLSVQKKKRDQGQMTSS